MNISGRKHFRATDLFTPHYIKLVNWMFQNIFYRKLAACQIMVTVSNPFFIACVALNNKSW
jgi:hypothetical protein